MCMIRLLVAMVMIRQAYCHVSRLFLHGQLTHYLQYGTEYRYPVLYGKISRLIKRNWQYIYCIVVLVLFIRTYIVLYCAPYTCTVLDHSTIPVGAGVRDENGFELHLQYKYNAVLKVRLTRYWFVQYWYIDLPFFTNRIRWYRRHRWHRQKFRWMTPLHTTNNEKAELTHFGVNSKISLRSNGCHLSSMPEALVSNTNYQVRIGRKTRRYTSSLSWLRKVSFEWKSSSQLQTPPFRLPNCRTTASTRKIHYCTGSPSKDRLTNR